MPMHGVVRFNLHSKLPGPRWRPSFAGTGLPERMRSMAFAFLGLTAAMGLTLVAVFAQLGFPVLSPAPLPSGPSRGGSVAEAVALDRSPAGFVRANPGLSRPAGQGGGADGKNSGTARGGQAAEPSALAAVPGPEPDGGTSGGQAVESPAPHTAPAPSPSPEPAADPAPTPKPAPTPARPATPTPAPAPGNSQSTAAAAHASERGIEASSKHSTGSSSRSAATSAAEPPAGASPGNDNGRALGHHK